MRPTVARQARKHLAFWSIPTQRGWVTETMWALCIRMPIGCSGRRLHLDPSGIEGTTELWIDGSAEERGVLRLESASSVADTNVRRAFFNSRLRHLRKTDSHCEEGCDSTYSRLCRTVNIYRVRTSTGCV